MHKPIYLDYAATTPIAPEVISAMTACMGIDGPFGNPHSTTHSYGLDAASIVEKARHRLAQLINAYDSEIIYTSGATEANNLALQGIAFANQHKGKHIISSQTEHKAVLDVLKFLEQQGFEVTYLTVNAQGLINLNELKAALRQDTILTSIMMVNNETGATQDIKQIAEMIHAHGSLLHVDGAQALGKIKIDVKDLDIDLMSFSAHKIYGPKGIGALYIRSKYETNIKPLIYGGAQERGLRPGTLAPFLIEGFSRATELAHQDLDSEIKRILALKKNLWEGLKKLPNTKLNSDFSASIPHICNVTLDNIDPESFLLNLEKKIAIAQGSACNSAHMEPSHVLCAMGLSAKAADHSFRFSFGRYTTLKDIDTTLASIQKFVMTN